ncbi:hypothetical protein OIU77_026505, partial [Salix suchowensis]
MRWTCSEGEVLWGEREKAKVRTCGRVESQLCIMQILIVQRGPLA